MFMLRDFLMDKPELCYALGIMIVVVEYLMIFLLFWRKTRLSAIYLGIVFHIALILTLDVPATFFFLFPPQLCLFIAPNDIIGWIERKRQFNASAKRPLLIYDGQCQFCQRSVQRLKVMDLFAVLNYVDLHSISRFEDVHPQLNKEMALKQICLVENGSRLYEGFDVFRRACFMMPMLYPFIFVFYFPGMRFSGSGVYAFIAKRRYWFYSKSSCSTDSCQK